MLRRLNHKAQTMGVPFQLIFSLIIVAVVIVFAFLAIRMFLERAEQAKFGATFTEIQNEIRGAWEKDATNRTITVLVPKKIEAVCFLNKSATCRDPSGVDFCGSYESFMNANENFFFYPLGIAEDYKSKSAWSLLCQNHSCITSPRNPLCFFKQDSNIKIKIVKNFDEPFVRLYEVY
ncbi:MAG: hypothetical protein QXP53_00940 [Candidatus Pacearchaeota archaeon]